MTSNTSENIRQAFFDWLEAGNAKKYSPSVAVACIDKISEYVVSKKICHADLWGITQKSVFKTVYKKILNTKLLRIMEKNTYNAFIMVGQLYEKFLKEKPWNQADKGSSILIAADSDIETDASSTEILEIPNDIARSTEDVLVPVDSNINPDDVIAWLVTQPNANGTLYLDNVLRSYMSALRNAPQKLIMRDGESRNVFSCRTVSELDKLRKTFKLSPNYIEINRTPWHGQLSAGLAVYRRYLEYLEQEGLEKDTSLIRSSLKHTIGDATKTTNGKSIIVYNWKSPTNINGTKPYSIAFGKDNSAVITKSWKALLMVTYNYAVMTFPEIDITTLTYGNGRRVLCSYNPNIVSYSEKLNCGLYVDTAWSANDVIGITEAIIKLCDTDISEVVISYVIRESVNPTFPTHTPLGDKVELKDKEKKILSVFKATFPMSMNLGFADLMKLKVAYKQQFGSDISLSDNAVYALVRNNSIKIADTRYTHIDNLVSPKTLKIIRQFIETELSKCDVHSRVYAKPLYDAFMSQLSVAVDEDLLLTIVEIAFTGTFKANRKSKFISNINNNNSLSVNEEIASAIVKLLSENVQPFSMDRIAQELPGYPRNKIEQVLNNGDPKIVTVDGTDYAHVDYVYIEDDDISKINNIISSSIATDGYITVDALLIEIKKNICDVFDGNEQISKQDIMKVIKQKISSGYKYEKDGQNGDRYLPKEGV